MSIRDVVILQTGFRARLQYHLIPYFCISSDVSRSVPVAWKSHFAVESKEAEDKMTSLKRSLLASDVKVTER